MAKEVAAVMLTNGDMSEMEVCGHIPSHKGQRAIILSNGAGCFAARLTPSGWVIIDEPVKLYPVSR